jgi:hypothetical protein
MDEVVTAIAGWVAQGGPLAPPNLWSLLIQAGIVSAVTGVFTLLHRSVVAAYREMVVLNKEIAATERARADTANEQLFRLMTPIQKVDTL